MSSHENLGCWSSNAYAKRLQMHVNDLTAKPGWLMLEKFMALIFRSFVIALLWVSAARAGEFEDAFAAFEGKNYNLALEKFKILAEQNVEPRRQTVAQHMIGTMYSEGHGVAIDYVEAMNWLKLSAERGLANSQFSIGNMYYKGHESVQDYTQATHWFRLAAEQGFLPALGNLGIIYGMGQGVEKDYVQAHKWFDLALARGDTKSAVGRYKVASIMTPEQISDAKRLAKECRARNFKNCD
jgi:TPR repeat protein